MPPNNEYTFFKPEEVVGLVPEFVSKLDLARKFAGIPFIITSGFRTPEENKSTPGSVSDSSHCAGLAVDLRIHSGHEAYLIIAAAVTVGITRWGVYADADHNITHVHLDDDKTKIQEDMWVRIEGAPYNSAPSTA